MPPKPAGEEGAAEPNGADAPAPNGLAAAVFDDGPNGVSVDIAEVNPVDEDPRDEFIIETLKGDGELPNGVGTAAGAPPPNGPRPCAPDPKGLWPGAGADKLLSNFELDGVVDDVVPDMLFPGLVPKTLVEADDDWTAATEVVVEAPNWVDVSELGGDVTASNGLGALYRAASLPNMSDSLPLYRSRCFATSLIFSGL